MVVQGAVTPGRTRRLMLKLPVGTLRRNSGERVRQERRPLSSCLSLSALLLFVTLFLLCCAAESCRAAVRVRVGFKKKKKKKVLG